MLMAYGCKTGDKTGTPAPADNKATDTPALGVPQQTSQEKAELTPLQQEENLDQKYDALLKKILEKEEKKKAEEAKEEAKELYRLKPGDTLEISVLDEPEMTRNLTVIPDGTITYLLIGEVEAAGKTVTQLRQEIGKSLEKYFVTPKVSVIITNIAKYEELAKPPKYMSIVGAVTSPGEYQVRENDRIIDIVARAGGLLYINDYMGGRTVANLKSSYLSRRGVKLDVDFDKLLRLGDMNYNLPVEEGDFIYISQAEDSAIFVLGEVMQPQLIPYNRDITIVEALSRAGGFTEKGEKSRVIVLRNSTTQNEFIYVDVEKLLYGDSEENNLILKQNDIVFVPEQGLSEYARYAGYLMTFGNLLLQGYQIRDQVLFPRLHRADKNFH